MQDVILADLDKQDRRARRFLRYFSLVPLANAGAGPDELQTYRNALAKLLNSLSWHPRITLPKAIDPEGLVLRIDLRDFQWDATLWNRLLAEYPYGILHDTAVARAVLVATATRMPCVRLDWFVANASRPPLYYDLLQIPGNAAELERQLRVDVTANIQQERVARAGFNGSGVSRNNRVLERHDAQNGAYWRTYDFNAVPQNLIERDILLPDRRNLFAYPLGPGSLESTFQHAGGEVIFNLPNGLQGYVLVNADNQRVDKAPTAIVSDPKRPDRAVEAGISCMNCHYRGILLKDDQIRDHVAKNPKAFRRADAELIRALYVDKKKMRGLMDEDAERFRAALAKTGNKVTAAEVVMAMTLRYEADVDLATLAAEAGVRPADLLPRLRSESLAKNLGALKVPGAVVSRQVVVQAFGDLVRELRLGRVFQAGGVGASRPDNTGEADPLEAQSSPANAAAFSPDGKLAAFAGADKSIRLWEIEGGRDLRRCIGHTASVWCVAFSRDGERLLSGGKDGTVRLWEVETGRELRALEGHVDLVTAVAFSPDGKHALSAGYDHEAFLWDLDKGKQISIFAFRDVAKYINAVAFSADGREALVCAERAIYRIDAATGKVLRKLEGHTASVVSAVFSADGKRILSGGDDRTLRLWDTASGKELRVFRGHDGFVKSVAFRADGQQVLSGGTDATVRLWDAASGKELRVFRKHVEPVVAVTFAGTGRQTLSVGRDATVELWRVAKVGSYRTPPKEPVVRRDPPAVIPAALRPLAVIRVGGTIGALHLAPDRSALYYLNRTDGTVGRVDTRSGKRTHVLRLAEDTDALCLTPDGKTLVATAPGRKTVCMVQLINPGDLSLRKRFEVAFVPYDVVATDAGLVFLTGGAGDWTDIAVVDANKGKLVTRWGGVWTRSFLRLAPDQRHLYVSSQGVTPGTVDEWLIPRKLDERPTPKRAKVDAKYPLGGAFALSPNGEYLLCRTGTILRRIGEGDLRFHATIGAFVSAAVAPERKSAFVVARDGSLQRYSYPDFKWQATHRLGLASYQVACDGKNGRLYLAGFDPRSVADRPRARGHGDIHVYALKDVSGWR